MSQGFSLSFLILISCLEEGKWGFFFLSLPWLWLASHHHCPEFFPSAKPGKRGCSEMQTGWTSVLRDLWASSEDTLSAPGTPALFPACSLGGREQRLVSTQLRPLPNWIVCGASLETPDFLLYPTHEASCFPLFETLFFFLLFQRAFIQ